VTPFVKICGITRLADAEAAIAAGASAIGFVFWPDSPRAIDPYRARDIVRHVPPFVTTVGVFVNQPAAQVNAIASLVGLGAVQLHGDEDLQFANGVKRPVLKAVGLTSHRPMSWPRHVMLLVDAHDPVRRGGTGRAADWTFAASIARERPIVLAGGLTADNVAEAVGRVRPFGIDVSSGVESAPGLKDHDRLAALFSRLRDVGSNAEGVRW
jgi:phosphoribosylanthranilate isomerase